MTSAADADGGAGRWRRTEELLGAALACDPAERAAFLDGACGDDDGLRREVASLIAAHDRPGAVDRLALDLAPLAEQLRDSTAPLVGRSVGSYRILEPVGGGGMGIVYKALDVRLDREVALKFLRPRLDADESAAIRFRHEARIVAALEHPNICSVHEIGETDDGQLYLVMPLYDGETLQRRIDRAPLAIDEAVDVAVQVARGLSKAHARGIVHRDVKPSNVLVTSDGIVKLLDFGIAKLADVTLTGAGIPLGTVSYMSPEQIRGAPLDHRTDLWSLGIVLHEMLAGVRPFEGGSLGIVAHAIQHAEPTALSQQRADVSPALERIIATALAKDPDNRYQSALAMERDLLQLADSGSRSALHGDERVAAPQTRPMPQGGARVGVVSRALRRRRAAVTIASLALALAAAIWLGLEWQRRHSTPTVVAAPASIAVLPFADRSARHDQEYFSDGISEELIGTLARVQGLHVASRTSSFAFRDRGLDIRAVGALLGVASVLEGSVRREGDKLRITAQLVSVADGYQLWSDTYDRPAGDAFPIQQEIARAIAATLRVKLIGAAPDSVRHDVPDATAYDLYLKGRHAWYSRTESGLRTAASYFERAVAEDPRYARAHAGLADAYAVLGFYDYLAPKESFPRAEASAARAIALDATLAVPHATLGYAAVYFHWDRARAEEEFRRAIAIDPNYSTAHQWYANLLTTAGRFPEAIREIRRAEEIDPLSLIAHAAMGWVLYHAGDPAAAQAQYQQTLEMKPDYAPALLWSGWALQELDSLQGAVRIHRRALAASDGAAIYVASLARSLALAGERTEAEALLQKLERRASGGSYVPAYEIAKVHDALGRTDQAFAWLERARMERSHSMMFLQVDPQLARLRTDPRFARLVKLVVAD